MKLLIRAVMAPILVIVCSFNCFAQNSVMDFNRYFEEIHMDLNNLINGPGYITAVGSDFIDFFTITGDPIYQYQMITMDKLSINKPNVFYAYPARNGMRVSSNKRMDRKGNLFDFNDNISIYSKSGFSQGVAMGWEKGKNNETNLVAFDYNGNIVTSFPDFKYSQLPIYPSTDDKKFINGVLRLRLEQEDGASSFVQLDRNFVPIQMGSDNRWINPPYKKIGFDIGGDFWPSGSGEKNVVIHNQNNAINKEFSGWGLVWDLMIIDMIGAGYDVNCGHILLAKGSLKDPEYLILKNKLYPYTEYGDIRFDSIRPLEKIEPSRVLDLFEDRMVVRGTGNAQDKVGIMDFDGNWTVEPVFRSIGAFHNGLAPAEDGGGKFGYITKGGTWAIAPIYDAAADFGCGYAAVVRDGVPMYIDDSGVVRKEFTAGTELGQFSERFAWVKENGTYSLLDMEFAPQFSGAYETVTPYCNGMSCVKQGGQELFLDLDGNVKFEVADGAAVSSFRDEFAIQKKDGVVEKIDKSRNVTDTYDQYTNVVDLGNGLMLGETSGGGVEVFDLFGYVLEQHDKTKLAELDDGTVLLVPEEGTRFTGIRKDDYFALWDQSYPQSLLKGNDEIIALLPDENLLYVGGEAKRIDMENVEVTPEVKDERTMVPLRVVSETLGYSVDWKDPDVTVTDYIDGEKKEIRLTMGSTTLAVTDTDGTVRQETMDVAPYEENGRTMVPLRFVAEQLGQQVHWDESGLVLISEAKMELTPTNIAQYLTLWK